jgi:iron-sulfur cluster assembly protein
MAWLLLSLKKATTKKTMVTVTDKAKEKVLSLMQEAGLDSSYFLRVSVKGGGCSGLSYNLDFDNEEKTGDQFFEDKGIRITLDMKSFLYLAGTELDFSDGLNGKGFNFNNPNASRTCGCGESFSV